MSMLVSPSAAPRHLPVRQWPLPVPSPVPLSVSHPGLAPKPPEPRTRALVAQVCAALDEVDHPMLLVNMDVALLWSNRLARRHCTGAALLQIEGSALRIARTADRERLGRAVAAAAAGRRSMLVLGPHSSAMAVAVLPLRDSAQAAAGSPGAGLGDVLLILARQEPCQALTLQFFAQANRLTPAEMGVLQALCRGSCPAQIAQDGGVAISTVRTQVSAIRHKTGAANTAALLRMVSALPPMVSTVGSVARMA